MHEAEKVSGSGSRAFWGAGRLARDSFLQVKTCIWAPMQSSLLAFAVLGMQAAETREARQERERAREERKNKALELLSLPGLSHPAKAPDPIIASPAY